MSFDAAGERAAIFSRGQNLCGGRFYDSLPDDTELARDPTTGLILPYIVLGYGTMIGTGSDRTLGGNESEQPQVLPVFFECWAATAGIAQDTAGTVRVTYLGWQPDAVNATEMILVSGGTFANRDANGRPTRFMASLNFFTTLNMSIPA